MKIIIIFVPFYLIQIYVAGKY